MSDSESCIHPVLIDVYKKKTEGRREGEGIAERSKGEKENYEERKRSKKKGDTRKKIERGRERDPICTVTAADRPSLSMQRYRQPLPLSLTYLGLDSVGSDQRPPGV